MSKKIYNGDVNSWTNPDAWTPIGVPQAGDSVLIESGTLSATALDIAGESISLERFSPSALRLSFSDSTLDRGTSVSSVGDDGNVNISMLAFDEVP